MDGNASNQAGPADCGTAGRPVTTEAPARPEDAELGPQLSGVHAHRGVGSGRPTTSKMSATALRGVAGPWGP